MCLAIPALVVERTAGDDATIDLGGVRKTVSLALVPEAAVGDYVIVHVGYAISRLDPAEAHKTLALFAQIDGASPAPAGAGAADASGDRPAAAAADGVAARTPG